MPSLCGAGDGDGALCGLRRCRGRWPAPARSRRRRIVFAVDGVVGAGFVGAIEAVEQVGRSAASMGSPLLRTERTAISRRSPQRHGQLPPGSVYLQALSKSRPRPVGGARRCPVRQCPRDRALPGKIPFEGHGLEGEASPSTRRLRSTTAAGPSEVWAPCGVGRPDRAYRSRGSACARLHLGALNPLALAGDGVTAALPQDGVVGEDDRERGLQFVDASAMNCCCWAQAC